MRMSTIHFGLAAFLLLSGAFNAAAQDVAQGAGGPLPPFKDDLFSNQTVLETRDNGAFEVIDYQEMRDINRRDQEPEMRVISRYVSLGVKKQQVDETLALGDRMLDVTRVGQQSGGAFTVIFIHGRGGDRRLGAYDYRFGGNFNRLKNLVVAGGGTYYSPSVKSFDTDGAADIAALIRYASAQSPGRPIVLTCASMGSFICWGITRDAESVKLLKGMAILGGASDPDFKTSPFYKARLPIWFTHGGSDKTYAAEGQEAFFEDLYKGKYPARFTLFQTGTHGTPVRMTDWRRVLNWILSI